MSEMAKCVISRNICTLTELDNNDLHWLSAYMDLYVGLFAFLTSVDHFVTNEQRRQIHFFKW